VNTIISDIREFLELDTHIQPTELEFKEAKKTHLADGGAVDKVLLVVSSDSASSYSRKF